MGQAQGQPARSARCIALVGPYLSGKTTLLESILFRTGAIPRQGKVAGNHGRRSPPERPAPRHERRAQCRHRQFHGRHLHLPRLSGFDRIRARKRAPRSPAAMRRSSSASPTTRRFPALQLILKQLDDLGIPRFLFINKIDKSRRPLARRARLSAAGELQAAGAAPDSRSGRTASSPASSISRSSAPSSIASMRRARSSTMPPTFSTRREGSALRHAREARRLRRRADGATALRHRAAARPGVRRSVARIARGVDHAGAVRLGRERQRHLAAAQGAAPRSARCRALPRSGLALEAKAAPRASGAQDLPYRAWRQAVAGARARRQIRRRRDVLWRERPGSAHLPASSRSWAATPTKSGEAKAGDTVALGRLDGMATGETLTDRARARQVAIASSMSPPVLRSCHLGRATARTR